jgi:hypothetical protein
MKYSLRSLIILSLVAPPLLGWGGPWLCIRLIEMSLPHVPEPSKRFQIAPFTPAPPIAAVSWSPPPVIAPLFPWDGSRMLDEWDGFRGMSLASVIFEDDPRENWGPLNGGPLKAARDGTTLRIGGDERIIRLGSRQRRCAVDR